MSIKVIKNIRNRITHYIGKVTRKYYFEDYIRVYPDGIVFNRYGRKRKTKRNTINNFLNHCKFYYFAAQFVNNKKVCDVGCGSGYGCEILHKAGASEICGSDISKHAIDFASKKYNTFAKFTIQEITDMKHYPDDYFDIVISSEVLEHVKEYGIEQKAIGELKRITCDGGMMIIGTPNAEMLNEHGFSYEEIDNLFKNNFSRYLIIENALVPSGEHKVQWEKRFQEGKHGLIVTERINLSETVLSGNEEPELKKGIDAGVINFANHTIDTRLLHNTHSWVVMAINEKQGHS